MGILCYPNIETRISFCRFLYSCRFAHLVITLMPISYSSLTLFCYVRYAAAFALRQRMLHFVQTYEHYMMFEVLEPSWHVMEKSLKTV